MGVMNCKHDSIRIEKHRKGDGFVRHYFCKDCNEQLIYSADHMRWLAIEPPQEGSTVVMLKEIKSDYTELDKATLRVGKEIHKGIIELDPLDRIALWNRYIADHYPSYVSAGFKLDKELLKN
jgi:hypothetical protein